jgi:D-glycero-alpha-D-manno-heptose-7-phosphate kinase
VIITQTPLRISLVGGGTDLPSFHSNHGVGRVVSFTIDKYIYIAVNPKFDGKVRVSYSITEMTESAGMVHHELVRECLMRMGIHTGIEIVSIADVPGKGTGLGSSSAYTVGLLNALNQYRILYGGQIRVEGIQDVADEACRIEIDRCKKPIGKQDQYAVAYGGLNEFEFSENSTPDIRRIPLDDGLKEELEDHLLLFWTGIMRRSVDILSKQVKIDTHSKIQALQEMSGEAFNLGIELMNGKTHNVGGRLHKNWKLKKSLVDSISNPKIDSYYRLARTAGAEGGKLCGAGGGGFLLFWASPDRHSAIKKAVGLRHIPFKIDPRGTRLYGGEHD